MTFKNITLPSSIEIFSEHHIAPLIRESNYSNTSPISSEQHDLINNEDNLDMITIPNALSDFDPMDIPFTLSSLIKQQNHYVYEDYL